MFAASFVISLARTPRRLAAFRERWPKQLEAPMLWPAHDGSANPPPDDWFHPDKYHSTQVARLGAWGCLQSHLGILRWAVEHGSDDWFEPLAIAQALGKHCIVEVAMDNCRFDGREDIYDFDGSVEFPDLSHISKTINNQ